MVYLIRSSPGPQLVRNNELITMSTIHLYHNTIDSLGYQFVTLKINVKFNIICRILSFSHRISSIKIFNLRAFWKICYKLFEIKGVRVILKR